MLGHIYEEEGLTNKLSVSFKGPGWAPGKPRLGDIEDIPKASTVELTYIILIFVTFSATLRPSHD